MSIIEIKYTQSHGFTWIHFSCDSLGISEIIVEFFEAEKFIESMMEREYPGIEYKINW